MPYYTMGDYYGRGDYYRGDGLFSGIGKLIGKATQFAGGLVAKYGPPGLSTVAKLALPYAAGGSKTALTSTVSAPALPMLPPPSMELTSGPGSAAPPGVITQSPLGTPVSAVGLAKQGVVMGPGGQLVAMRGYHLNKSYSYRRKTGQLIAPHTTYVKNRRMNWANGRALGHAERRIGAFVRHAQRYIKWVHPKKEGHAAPKFGRRKHRA